MSTRENRDAAYPLSIHIEIRRVILERGLGIIPDPVEDYLSVKALSHVLKKAEKTIRNHCPPDKVPRHHMGLYMRLTDVLKAWENKDGEETD